jgi:hypothetical protein
VAAPKLTDEEFARRWPLHGCSPVRFAQAEGYEVNAVYKRRAALAKRGIVLKTVAVQHWSTGRNGHGNPDWQVEARPYRARQTATIKDGTMIVFGDAHYWPGEPSLAHQTLCLITKRLQPKIIIANGDVFDGATISRHDVLGWQKLPTVIEELHAAKTRLDEITRVSPKAERFFTIGNHDSRFDRRLATEISEFESVPGMKLEDHLKGWPMSYSVLINEDSDPLFVVHNIRGGMYAPRNNVLAAGCTVITGHLHSQKALPVKTLLNEWEGIDHGCLADVDHPAFSYRMDRPADWRSGFVVMTFDKEGRHLPAEFCRVQVLRDRSRAVFRGEIVLERKHAVPDSR